MRAYVQRVLGGRFSVETVGDGQAALEAAQRRPPALVLTDVMTPRLDGFGLLRKLRADPALSTVPVVMLSARAGEEAKGEGLEAGADDYLVKPFSGRELLARVTTHLKLAGARAEIERALGREQALKEADRRKDEFIMLSHEFAQPARADPEFNLHPATCRAGKRAGDAGSERHLAADGAPDAPRR